MSLYIERLELYTQYTDCKTRRRDYRHILVAGFNDLRSHYSWSWIADSGALKPHNTFYNAFIIRLATCA